MTTEREMNLVSSPKLQRPAASWMMPMSSDKYTASCSGERPLAAWLASIAATMMLMEFVGPKTWWWEEKNRAPIAPPTTTEVTTGMGGRPRMRAKPIACGIETRERVAPETRSARHFSQE